MQNISFNKYLSGHIYDNLVDKNDFFRHLDELVDWRELTFDLHLLAKNEHGGRPRFSHVTLFKMLFLSFLYNASDRLTEEMCTQNIRCKYFLGLDIMAPSPDHSTLSVFRDELLKNFGQPWLDGLFSEIVQSALRYGISFSTIYALDSTHSIANVDTSKDRERQKTNNQPPRDTDASWGVKGLEQRINAKQELVKVVKSFYGYKAHLIAETDKGFIASLSATPGNVADVNAGDKLIFRKFLPEHRKRVDLLTADKGYGSSILIGLLEQREKIKTAFSLNGQFFKGDHAEHWREYLSDAERTEARKQRSVIERVNADLKNNHGLRKARYLGLAKFTLQLTMTAIIHNLKILIKGVRGVKFRMT
jgi:IS5 family transposase